MVWTIRKIVNVYDKLMALPAGRRCMEIWEDDMLMHSTKFTWIGVALFANTVRIRHVCGLWCGMSAVWTLG